VLPETRRRLGRLLPGRRRMLAIENSIREVIGRMEILEAELVEGERRYEGLLDEIHRWSTELAAAIPRVGERVSEPEVAAVRARLADLVRRLDQLANRAP
jgi:hypothetical protein